MVLMMTVSYQAEKGIIVWTVDRNRVTAVVAAVCTCLSWKMMPHTWPSEL